MRKRISSIIPAIKTKLTGDMIVARYAPGTDLSKASEGNEFRVSCFLPGHSDPEPSLMISKNKFMYNCFSGCNGGDSRGDFIKLIQVVEHTNFAHAVKIAAALCGVRDLPNKPYRHPKVVTSTKKKPKPDMDLLPLIPETVVKRANMVLLHNWNRYGPYFEKRMISKEAVIEYKIGLDWHRNKMIPVYEKGILRNIRYRNVDSHPGLDPKTGKPCPKYWSHSVLLPGASSKTKYGSGRLFNGDRLRNSYYPIVILSAGEFDGIVASLCMPGTILGVSVTSGESSWNMAFNDLFKNSTVLICYDNDEAGRRGATAAKENIPGSMIMSLEGSVGHKGDITNFVSSYGFDVFAEKAMTLAGLKL